MEVFLLSIYIAVLFIRPMDWWPPVYGWELINWTALVLLFVSMPRVLAELRNLWSLALELRVFVWFLVAATASWLPSLWLQGLQDTFSVVGKLLVLYFLILLLGREPQNAKILLWTLLLAITWMAVHGILQYRTGAGFGGQAPAFKDHPDGIIYRIRAFGYFDDPNDLCIVFVLALPLLFAEYRATGHPLVKAVCLGVMAVFAYAATLTNSRGGFMGLFGMAVAYFADRTKGFRRWLLLSGALAILTVIAPSRVQGLGEGDRSRAVNWGDSLAAFKEHKLFGVGWNDIQSYTDTAQTSHNTFLNVLAECGLVGYVPFFLLIYCTLVHVKRAAAVTHRIDRPVSIRLSGMYSSLVGYCAAAYFISRQYTHTPYILLALATAQVLNVCRDPMLAAQIYRPRQDLRTGTIVALSSVAVMWITIRIAHLVSG